MNDFSIRLFRYPEDYDAAIALWKAAGPGINVRRSDEPEMIAHKLQRDPDLFLVAEAQGQIIGTVIGGYDGRRGMVYHLAVVASARQRGVGAALMDELESRLRQKGCIRCYLMVTAENENAMRFYEARGWEPMTVHTYGKNLD